MVLKGAVPKNAPASASAEVSAADVDLVKHAVGHGAPERLLVAALECSAQRGFYATTTRDISANAGMSPTAMYVHYASKGEVLYRLMHLGHQDALRVIVDAIAGHDDPTDRLWHLVAGFASWHASHHRLARVAQYELRAVPPEHVAEIRALRQKVSLHLEAEIKRGVEKQAFDVPDIHDTVRAILSLCIDIARWYRPNGRRAPEELGRMYADLVNRMCMSDPRAGQAAGYVKPSTDKSLITTLTPR